MSDERLTEYRARLEEIDREVIRLISERVRIAKNIGLTKTENGSPIRDYRMEKRVIDRARRFCDESGVDREIGEQIATILISGAVRAQEHIHQSRYEGELHRILIVGGAGKMGRWLANILHAQGHRVTVFDPSPAASDFEQATTLAEGARGAKLIVLATPLESSEAVYEEILHLEPTGVIADVFSVKSQVTPLIERGVRDGRRIVSLHPMFGPDVYLLSGRTLLICDCGSAGTAHFIRDLFEGTALTLMDVPLARHDEIIAYVLGLGHAINLLFARCLCDSGRSPEEIVGVSSTTFEKQLRASREVCSENPRLYFDIQNMNPLSPMVFDVMENALDHLRSAALDPDPSAFERIMTDGDRWFGAVMKGEG